MSSATSRRNVSRAAAVALALCLAALAAAPRPSLADTCSNAGSRVGSSAALPDCRAYELVTPDLNSAAPPNWPDVEVQGITADGSALAFAGSQVPVEAEGATAAENTILAHRGPSGWSAKSLSGATPLSSGTFYGPVPSVVGVSEDLSESVLWSDQPLAGTGSPSGANLYLRRDDGTIHALTTAGALGLDPAASLSGASRDFTRLFLKTTVQQPGTGDPLLNGNLYEYSAGQLHLVPILPGSPEEPVPAGGYLPQGPLSPVSADGREVLFKGNLFPGLYLRENANKSVEVSKSQRVPPDPNPPAEAIAAGIAADGQTVLFTSANELTDDANTGRSGGVSTDAGADLYAYDVASEELTDLSVDSEAADEATGADVEEVLGSSADADYVYFVARGKLAPGGTSGQRNLYVAHAGATKYIATDPEPGAHFYVTPDGLHAAFLSSAPAGGYDNGGHAMAYRYDYGGAPVCASCRSDGEPAGSAALLAGRSLSDDGSRLFFQSSDALLPAAQSTLANVFEYTDGTLHLLSPGEGAPAILLGASASGDDVFLAAFEALAPDGPGSAFAIYDARVGAVVPPAADPPGCQNEGCRGPGSTPAPEQGAGSADFEAPAKVSAPSERKVAGRKVGLRVIVPSAGTLEIGGRGFAGLKLSPGGAGSVAATVALRDGADRKRRRFGIFRTEAEVLFRSASGAISRASVPLTFYRGGKG